MKFNVLGPLEITSNGKPVTLNAKRPRTLLVILLLHSARIVSMEQIIDGLWAQDPPRSAVENVRTYVSQLRHILSESGDGGARLESHPGGYRLTVAPDQVDLERFTALADSGRQALQANDFARSARLLDEATRLWRGSPLHELEHSPAIRAKTIALEEHRWRVQADWIRARLALGDHLQLVATLRELLGERPLEETLWCFLMTALYQSGRTGEALTVFSEARSVFVGELGIEPGPQLRNLQAKVLAGADLDTPESRSAHCQRYRAASASRPQPRVRRAPSRTPPDPRACQESRDEGGTCASGSHIRPARFRQDSHRGRGGGHGAQGLP